MKSSHRWHPFASHKCIAANLCAFALILLLPPWKFWRIAGLWPPVAYLEKVQKCRKLVWSLLLKENAWLEITSWDLQESLKSHFDKSLNQVVCF